MPAKVRCPTCDTSLTAPDELLGQTVRCEECGQTFTATAVRRPSAAALADRPARRRDADDDSGEFDRPRPRRRKRQSGGAAFAIATVAVLFVVAAVGGALFWATGKSKPAAPPMLAMPMMNVRPPAVGGMAVPGAVAPPAAGQKVTLSNPKWSGGFSDFEVDYAFAGGRPLGGVWYSLKFKGPDGSVGSAEMHFVHNATGTLKIHVLGAMAMGGRRGPLELWVEESDRPNIGPFAGNGTKVSNSVTLP